MRFTGFIGPSYTLQSVNVDCQRCINLYPEMDEIGTGNSGEVASLVSTPGLTLLVALPTSPVRGTFCDSTGQLWAVGGNTLYQLSSIWGAISCGTLLTSTGPVSFCDNGLQVVLVDGPYGYFWTIKTTNTFAQIVDESFLGASQVCFLDSYFIFNEPNTQQFYLSPQDAVIPFNGLDVGSAEAHPDPLVGIATLQENLYLFSKKHTEVWYDAGAAGFPLQRIQGSVIEIGCAAGFTIAAIQTAIFWLGQDLNGNGTVYRSQGLQPQRISTYAIENEIRALGDLSSARAWTYQQAGHSFYCLNLPGANTTWVFDTTTSLWHERTYLSNGLYQRHLADCQAFAYNINVVGDYSSGNIYSLDPNAYSDNGAPIRRERASPHISKDLNRIFHSQFWLDLEAGVGLDGVGQGTKPQVMLSWSNDYGHSWSNEHWTSVGAIGARKTRAIWRRLGASRDRVYRVQITDPVKVTLLGAEIEIEEGTS